MAGKLAASENAFQELHITYNIDTKKKLVAGLIIVIGIAFSWVGTSQLTENAYTKTFNAPSFMMWFTTSWMSLSYLPVLMASYIRKTGVIETFRDDEKVLGANGVCPESLLKVVLPFCLVWCGTNYCFTRALGKVAVTDVTAMFSSCNAFVYVFSILILNESFHLLRLLSVALSISGVVLMANADGFQGPSLEGVILSVISAVGAAVYKVMFKRVFGDTSANKVALFLSLLGIVNFLVLWPPFEILYFTKEEVISWSEIPWNYLCGRSILSLVFNFLINFGIAFTFPLFISLGTILGIPINGIVDTLYRSESFSSLKIAASFLIVGGFILMLFPANFFDRFKARDPERKSLMT